MLDQASAKAQAELELRKRKGEYDPPVIWQPQEGAQALAYYSEADELFYGGQAGGGKTDLVLGLAVTAHTKSIIFRRIYENLKEIEERSREIYSDYAQYNGMRKIWKFTNGKRVDFGAIQHEHDKSKYRGRPHDLKAFDELPEFTESQYLFIIGWLRTIIPTQRTRIVNTGNPPDTEAGRWVIRRWAPWLDAKHHNPAEPGELRWYAMLDGKDTPVDGGEPFEYEGETRYPKSRTFIPAGLSDNKYLADTGYAITLDNLPEPLRGQLKYGDFTVGQRSDEWQVIPTEWIQQAMDRWEETPKPDIPLSCMGVDCARGGKDDMVMSKRYGAWFAELIKKPGADVLDGATGAAHISKALGMENAEVNIDVIGIGSSVYDFTLGLDIDAVPINFAEASGMLDKSGKLQMRNIRAEAYWKMREDLDPVSGMGICLPPDPQVLSDLAAPRWSLTTAGVLIEPKKDIIKRIGRSPDTGDAVVLANLSQSSGIYI